MPSRLSPSRPPAGRACAWLELLRPANVATSLADVLAGAAVAGLALVPGPVAPGLGWLLVATACLYAGGIVLNDVFDLTIDVRERPERPIPSGRIAVRHAALAGAALLAAGVAAAAVVGAVAAVVAAAIVAAVLSYDAWGKHHAFLGPLNMGLCRALNLLLGIALLPAVLARAWPLGLLPLAYIAAVTMVSRGEVHGARRPVVLVAIVLLTGVIVTLIAIALTRPITPDFTFVQVAWAVALAIGLAWRVLPAFTRAATTTAALDIRRAVRAGVLSLVLADAVLAAAYAGIMSSLAVLVTGLLAWWLARLFAVT